MNVIVVIEYIRSKIYFKKFVLGVVCVSILMMFVVFISVYIVCQVVGNWLEFCLLDIFYINMLVILLSSVIVYGFYFVFKWGKMQVY